MMKAYLKIWRLGLFGLWAVLLAMCGIAEAGGGAGPEIRAAVSILPQADVVSRIGGRHAAVQVLVGPGQSPATYEPSPRQMAGLARCRVYFRIGTPFEETLVPKISSLFPALRIVDTRKGIRLRYFKGSAGPRSPDPHVWLDPKRLRIQAGTVSRALAELAPALAGEITGNLGRFEREIDRLDAEISRMLAPFRGRRFYVFHPAFGYFADAYGLVQVAVEAGGRPPGPRRLSRLIRRARSDGVRVLFVQPQYARRDAAAIAEAIGARVVPLDPLPRDCIKGIMKMAVAVRDGLQEQAAGPGPREKQ